MTCYVVLLVWTCNGRALLISSHAWQSAPHQNHLVAKTLRMPCVSHHQVQATSLRPVFDLFGVVSCRMTHARGALSSCRWRWDSLQKTLQKRPHLHMLKALTPQVRCTLLQYSLTHSPTHPLTHSIIDHLACPWVSYMQSSSLYLVCHVHVLHHII